MVALATVLLLYVSDLGRVHNSHPVNRYNQIRFSWLDRFYERSVKSVGVAAVCSVLYSCVISLSVR